MYTQQSNALASALNQPAGQQQNRAIMQVFANCIQGLRTNGPLSVNGDARNTPPRTGVINSPPGIGAIGNRPPVSGNSLQDYASGYGDRNFNEYPTNVWNTTNVDNGSYITNNINNAGAPYFGGDTFYGNEYLTTNQIDNRQNYNNYNSQNYNEFYNVDNSTNTAINNNNVNNWSNNQFTDNSYNDFSTVLNTTQNAYNSTTNNFEGDNYFDNTVTGGTTVNVGGVTNISSVTNQGDVVNQGDVFNEGAVYVNIGGVNVNLQNYITTQIQNFITNRLGPTKAEFTGTKTQLAVSVTEYDPSTGPVLNGSPPTLVEDGTYLEPVTISIPVPHYTFNSETCSLDETSTDVEVEFDVTMKEYSISGGNYTLSGLIPGPLVARAVSKTVDPNPYTPAGKVKLL